MPGPTPCTARVFSGRLFTSCAPASPAFATASFATRPLAAPTLAVFALLCTGAAWADDPNPYYIGINQALTHDTNINRIAGGRPDTYSSSGLVGGLDQQIGRQRVYGSGNVTLNRYRDQTGLNNTSYALNAGLDWQTIDRFSGTVFTSLSQSLASLNNNLLQTTTGNNIVRSEQFGSRVNWGGNAAVTVQAGYGYNKSSYSDPSLQASDSNNNSADIGTYYHPGETLTLGTALRYTRSNADRAFLLSDGSYLANKTSGRNIDLSANWHPTVQSGVNARISFTHQSNSSSGGTTFSGLTGALSFNYVPTGKLSFNGQLSRDASTNGNFYNTFNGTTNQSTVGLASSSTVSNSATLGAVYSATAKVGVTASLQYIRTTQPQSGTGNTALFAYRDNLKSASLGATWSIRRNWSAGCNLSRVLRTLDGSFVNDYTSTSYGCYTQVTLK